MSRPSLDKIVIGLIFISLVLKFFIIPFNQGMWWDEAVYLGLSRSISQGYYALELNTTLETFRSPLFPLLITPIRESALAVRFFAAITSIVAIFGVYLLGKEMFNKRTGLLAALLTSGSFYFVFFSIKALSEPLLVALVSFSMYFFHKWTKNDKTVNIYLAGIFTGLAIMTRYFAGILFISYLVYFAFSEKKHKMILEFLSGCFLILFPWFVMNQLSYGNPVGALISNLGFYSKEVAYPLERTLEEIVLAMGPLLIALPLGVAALSKKTRSNLQLMSFTIFSLGFFALLHHKEPRYLLSFYPAYAVISAYAINKIRSIDKTKLVIPTVFVIMMLTTAWALQTAWVDRVAASGLINATTSLKEFTEPGETVLAQSYPYVYYFAGTNARKFPYIEEDVGNTIRNNSIRYVLYHKFEDGNPAYAADYFKRFEVVKTFEEWRDPEAVVIYRINETLL